MKNKKLLIKMLLVLTSIGIIGGASTIAIASCSCGNNVEAAYSITPKEKYGVGTFTYTATKTIEGKEPLIVSETYDLDSHEKCRTSIWITFEDGDEHRFDVYWMYTVLSLSYSSNNYIFSEDETSTTGIPTLKDDENQDVTATFKITEGALPDDLNFNQSTGEISGKPAKASEYVITITATGTGKWSGLTCSKTISIKVVQYVNAFVLKDGKKINITNPNGLMILESNSIDRLNNTNFTSEPILQVDNIKEIHITPDQTITSVGDNYGKYLCYQMEELTIAEINLPPNITSVGDDFCSNMFVECELLNSFPSGLNLPSGITSIGNNFCSSMFEQCTVLKEIPESFNLPQGITIAKSGFCLNMFWLCTKLDKIPQLFNLPQNITSIDNGFCFGMFSECESLELLPEHFNLPQLINGEVKDAFCADMFYECGSLLKLPDTFNLPTNITSVGEDFCNSTFEDCESLTSLPTNFNLPQNISSLKSGFCVGLFVNCNKLTYLPLNFNLPSGITQIPENFCVEMFYGCSVLGGAGTGGTRNFYLPNAVPNSDNTINNMFSCCSKLTNVPTSPTITQLKNGFNISRS